MAINDISKFQPFNAQVVFNNLPGLTFFSQQWNIPSAVVGFQEVRKGFGSPAKLHGTSFNYAPLRFSWMLEETLESYFAIHDWMARTNNPEALNSSIYEVGDCSMLIFNNNGKLINTINFTNAFPISISDIECDTKIETDAGYVANAEFEFELMKRG